MLRSRASWGAGALVAAVLAVTGPAHAQPAGFAVRSSQEIGQGVSHVVLTRESPAQLVHVAKIAPGAPFTLRTVLSNESVAGPGNRLERTSSMCARTNCLVAVNGDFARLDDSQPVGGVVSLGEMVRSPVDSHHQLVMEPESGRLAAGRVTWTGQLMPTDLRPIDFTGVNTARGPDDLILYTSANGPSTLTNQHGVELSLRVVQPQGPIRVGQTAIVEIAGHVHGQGDSAIPRDGAVLSGHGRGAAALNDLWRRIQSGDTGPQALLRLETSPSAMESVGGSPVLLRDGSSWFSDAATSFVRGRHPRTAVGWNPSGETFLVTVDGRQPGYSEGMSLAELTDLMAALGATDAINLDGGGSTTFVAGGQVANRPSDRAVRRGGETMLVPVTGAGEHVIGNVERPVVIGLVLVPRTTGPVPAVHPLAGNDLGLPQALALPPPLAVDPASHPGAGLPALIPLPAEAGPAKALPVATALAMLALLGALASARSPDEVRRALGEVRRIVGAPAP